MPYIMLLKKVLERHHGGGNEDMLGFWFTVLR